VNGSAISREILGNVPAGLVGAFYALAFAACGWAVLVLLRRSSARHRARRPAQSPPPLGERLLAIARYLAFHERLRRDRFAGIAHLLITYGFFILFVGTSIVFLEHQTPLHFFYGRFYRVASLAIDLGGLAFIAGLLMFLARRHFGREEQILCEPGGWRPWRGCYSSSRSAGFCSKLRASLWRCPTSSAGARSATRSRWRYMLLTSARRRCRSGIAHSGAATRLPASCFSHSFRGSFLVT